MAGIFASSSISSISACVQPMPSWPAPADITLLGKPEYVVAVVQAGVVRQNTMRTS